MVAGAVRAVEVVVVVVVVVVVLVVGVVVVVGVGAVAVCARFEKSEFRPYAYASCIIIELSYGR